MHAVSKIRERMPVVAADGRAIGFVNSIVDGGLMVTSVRDGRGFNHVVPLSWVDEVGGYVFLNKGSGYVAANCDPPSAALCRLREALAA